MITNANWLEHIQQKSATLCFSCFFSLHFLQPYLCTLSSKVAHFMIQEASNWQPFFIHSFVGSKLFPSLIDNIRLRIPCRNIRNCTLFHIAARNSPSTGHSTAAKLDILRVYIYIYFHQTNKIFLNRCYTISSFNYGFDYLSKLW